MPAPASSSTPITVGRSCGNISSAIAIAVFTERYLHCHRAQINSTEFLNGVRTVLKRDNVVEALSICDATPGPDPVLRYERRGDYFDRRSHPEI